MKYRKKTVIALVLLMIITNSLVVTAGGKMNLPNAYVKVGSTLNLREGPSTSYKVLSKLEPGELVYVEKELDNGWNKVSLADGREGYVLSEYIVKTDKDASKYELISAAVITASNSSQNRNFNMSKACEAINGLTLESGDEFNWYGKNGKDGIVGPASKANGYKEATIISGGKYVKGYGGGVCQVSTAVYNCIYKLGIKPTEHYHHSLTSTYVEKGMDATVSYPNKNFVFTNTEDYPIMFEAYTDGGQVIVVAYKVLD